MKHSVANNLLTPARVLTVGFAGLILLGGILLSLQLLLKVALASIFWTLYLLPLLLFA